MVKSQVKVGVLALQGDFAEHLDVLKSLKVNCILVKKTEELSDLDGLIIPGGESTTIKKLIDRYGFEPAIKSKIDSGMSLWGTCAGLICIAEKLTEEDPDPMKFISAEVSRNWFGRQVDSFETELEVNGFDSKFPAIFIRAPIVESVAEDVNVLSKVDDQIVLCSNKTTLVASFHPELSSDLRIHELFLSMAI